MDKIGSANVPTRELYSLRLLPQRTILPPLVISLRYHQLSTREKFIPFWKAGHLSWLRRMAILFALLACVSITTAQSINDNNDEDEEEEDSKSKFPNIEFEVGTNRKSGVPERPAPENIGPFGTPRTAEEFGERAIISSKENIRTENDVAYAGGRTRVEYNEITLEADKMIIDMISGDIQAEGRVIYTGPNDYVRARAGRFNLTKGEGVAYGVDGQTGDLFFKSVWDEKKKGPSFRQITERESVFKGTHFITCDFPVPMYYISASEVILMRNRRIYFRNPVVYIRGVPVFWMPWYSRNLAEGSPWSQFFGFNSSSLGFFYRLGYRYVHKTEVPDWDNPTTTRTRSHGQLDANVDMFSQRGIGVGAEYRYQFDYGRHRGWIMLYGIRDRDRDVPEVDRADREPAKPVLPGQEDQQDDDNGKDESQRYVYRHEHNSKVTDNIYLLWNADWISDPDIYVDILDRFTMSRGERRGRLYERRLRGAASYQTKDWLARFMFEKKQRLGRDRYTDFTIPGDDDLEFDPDPDFADDEEFEADGISRERFANVSKNAHFRYATRLLRLMSSPLYYRFQANAFDSLDAGYNRLNEEDDARVRGVDFYGQLTHRLRLGSRTTWTNQLGAGVAFYEREDVPLISRDLFEQGSIRPPGVITPEVERAFFLEPDPHAVMPGPIPGTFVPDPNGVRQKPLHVLAQQPNTRRIDGLRFKDQNTVVLGDSDTERSPDDAQKAYVFGDYTTRLNHRFTDFLEGFLRYNIRQGSGMSLGEYYESTGRKDGTNDIYNFYSDRHYLEAGLLFYLRYPNLYAAITGGYNLQGRDQIYANERLRYLAYSMGYRNSTNEFQAQFATGFQTRQIYDRNDPRSFDQGSLGTTLKLSYLPRHHRYWAYLNIIGNTKLEKDPNDDRDNRQKRRFNEDKTDIDFNPTIGRQFGPKYRVQVTGNYKTKLAAWEEIGVAVIRDLHDAELGLFFGVQDNDIESRRDEDDDLEEDDDDTRKVNYEYTIRISLNFKIAKDQPGLGNRTSTTLADVRSKPQFVQ